MQTVLNNKDVERLSQSLQRMIFMMKEADNRCVCLSDIANTREVYVVSFVGDNDKVIMKDIADYLNIPMSTTTGIVDKMVKRNLLQRIFSEEDRRSIRIGLTDKGKEIFELIRDLRNQSAQSILSVLNESEVNSLILLLEKATAGFNHHIDFEQESKDCIK